MEAKNVTDDLKTIRNLMERSSKFISLSGLAGILAGIYALIGTFIAHGLIYTDHCKYQSVIPIPMLIVTALCIFSISIITGILLTIRKAKQKNLQVWSPLSKTICYATAIPLVAGGIFSFILLNNGHYDMIAPVLLLFYGLALLAASNYTFSDIKYLGVLEIVVGLVGALLPQYGLLFWAFGFGILHIIYGSIMYFKYDR